MNQGYGGAAFQYNTGLGFGQFPGTPHSSYPPAAPAAIAVSPPHTVKPPWVDELFDKLGKMDQKLCKLDVIEKKLEGVISRVDSMESEVKVLRETTGNTEEAVTFQGHRFDEVEKRMDKQSKKIEDLSKQIKEVSKGSCDNDLQQLREKVLDVQSRSMRDNLVFVGVKEESTEDTHQVLQTFMADEMKIDKHLDFVRVHRMGAPRSDRERETRPRPIVAKFAYYKDRDLVRQTAFEGLKGTRLFVNEQFPKEIEDRRKRLYPVRRTAYQAGGKTVLTVDKLYINGQLYIHRKPVHSSRSELLRRTHKFEDLFKPRTATQGATAPTMDTE